MNIAEWAANEILNRGMDYYNVALEALTDSTLRQTLGADLVDGALIGRDVELGEDVTVERGAVILGQTKILRGRVEQGAVVVDCVARVMEARSGSLLFLIEQLNERQVESEPGQLLTDIIIMDEEIVRKVRVVLEMGAIPEEEVVLVNGKHKTVAELMRLSDFEAFYLGGSSAGYRQTLLDQSLDELFGRTGSLTRFKGNPILLLCVRRVKKSHMLPDFALLKGLLMMLMSLCLFIFPTIKIPMWFLSLWTKLPCIKQDRTKHPDFLRGMLPQVKKTPVFAAGKW